MMKKYLILLAGPPATGKSYLSRLICQALPQTYTVSPDEIKQDLSDSVGFDNMKAKLNLEMKGWELYYQALDLYMTIGKQFVLTEYPFSDKQKPILQNLAEEHGYHIITIRLVADFEILWERRIKRDLAPERHLSFIMSHYHYGDQLLDRHQADDLITKDGFWNIIEKRQYNYFQLGKLYEVNVTDYQQVDYSSIISDLLALSREVN